MNQLLLQKAEKFKVSDFNLLIELARLGSLRETARLLRSTPAQISRRLKHIEQVLGYRIFERGPKGLILTGAGQQVLKLSLLVNGEFQSVLEHRRNKRALADRPIGFASTSFLLSYAVIPALAETYTQAPNLRSYVLSFNPDDLVAAGIKGAFHVAVHSASLDWPRTWQSVLVGQIRWGLFAKKHHPILRAKYSLDELPFVYPMMWDGDKLVIQNDNCPLPVNQRNSVVGTQTAEQAMHMIRLSNMVGFLPYLLMRESLASGEVVEIPRSGWPTVEQPVYLSIRTDAITEVTYEILRRELRSVLKL